MSQTPAPLPYWMFLVVGGLVSGYSSFIMLKGENVNVSAMKFFFFIGLFFILIGVIKFLIKSFSTKEEKFASRLAGINTLDSEEKRILKQRQMNALRNQNNNQTQSTNMNKNINSTSFQSIYCSQCGNRCFPDSIYCSKCGSKIRR